MCRLYLDKTGRFLEWKIYKDKENPIENPYTHGLLQPVEYVCWW